jgi:hypothetical protein
MAHGNSIGKASQHIDAQGAKRSIYRYTSSPELATNPKA